MKNQVPHFTHPFRFYNASSVSLTVATAEQDSEEEILTCVESILRYPIGYRNEKPQFGLSDPTFTEGRIDPVEIEETIGRWEPRATLDIAESLDEVDSLIARIRISPSPTELRREERLA